MLGSFCSLGFLQLLLNCDKRLPCIVSCSEFVDHMAGGNTIQRLSKIPEFEVTMPNQADRLMMTAEVCDSFSTTCFLTAVVLCQAGSPLCVALAMPYIIIKQHAVMTKAAMTKTFRTQDLACPHMTAAPRPYTCPGTNELGKSPPGAACRVTRKTWLSILLSWDLKSLQRLTCTGTLLKLG